MQFKNWHVFDLGFQTRAQNFVSIFIVWTIAQITKNIFHQAVCLLKFGGVLVYSTCSLWPEENEKIVEWILHKWPWMRLEKQVGKNNNIVCTGCIVTKFLAAIQKLACISRIRPRISNARSRICKHILSYRLYNGVVDIVGGLRLDLWLLHPIGCLESEDVFMSIGIICFSFFLILNHHVFTNVLGLY
jgi:hypothetical protein